MPILNDNLSVEQDRIVASGKEGLVNALAYIANQPEKKTFDIHFKHEHQQSILRVDTQTEPFQFWFIDFLGRAASPLEKNVIANFLQSQFNATNLSQYFHQYTDIPAVQEAILHAWENGEVEVYDFPQFSSFEAARDKLNHLIANKVWDNKFKQAAEERAEPKVQPPAKAGWAKLFGRQTPRNAKSVPELQAHDEKTNKYKNSL